MLSDIGRLTQLLIASLSCLLICSSVQASTWIPISNGSKLIFVPSPSLEMAQADTFQMGSTDVLVDLGDIGSTSLVFYQYARSTDGSTFAVYGDWQCQDLATLNGNNNDLKFTIQSGNGIYKANVAAVMGEQSCDAATLTKFQAGELISSTAIETTPFVLISDDQINCPSITSGDCLRQNPATTKRGDYNRLNSYDLFLSWPVIDGIDEYKVTLTKDDTPYEFTVSSAEFNNTSTEYLVEDIYDAVNGFTPYTGFGKYSFKVQYCYEAECSASLSYLTELNVRPLYPSSFSAYVGGNEGSNDIKMRLQTDPRTTRYRVKTFFFKEGSGTGLIDIGETFIYPQVPDNLEMQIGHEDLYLYEFVPNQDGKYKYKISPCDNQSICEPFTDQYDYSEYSSAINNDVNIPIGGFVDFVIGDDTIVGWVFDGDTIATYYQITAQQNTTSVALNAPLGANAPITLGAETINNGFTFSGLQSKLVSAGIDINSPFNLVLSAQDFPSSTYANVATYYFPSYFNQPPVANNDAITSEMGLAKIINVLENDTDIEGQDLTVVNITSSANAQVTINADGTLTYTPSVLTSETATDTFTYQVKDEQNVLSNVANVTVTFSDFNYPPVMTIAAAATTNEDTPTASISFTLADQNDGVSDLTVTMLSSSNSSLISTSNLVVTGTGGSRSMVLTPAPNANGSSDLVFMVSDGKKSSTANLTLTVNSVNDLPLSQGGSAVTSEDNPLVINLHGSDVDGDNLTYNIVNQPSNGSLSANGASYTYTPNPNYSGSDSFVYRVYDGSGYSNNATINLTITQVNDTPVASNVNVTTNEDNGVSLSLLGVDADGDALTYQLTSSAVNGTITGGTGANRTYTPNANFNGTETLTYVVNDGLIDSGEATLTITVSAVNDVPLAYNDAATVSEDGSVIVNVLANDSDVDGDSLTVTSASSAQGAVIVNQDNSLSFNPSADFNGSATIDYSINDGNGGVANAVVNVTVNTINDAPVAVNDNAVVAEDGSVIVNVLANDSDIEGDSLTVTSASSTQGAVIVNVDNSLSFSPSTDFNGPATIDYSISDGNGGAASAVVNVTVNPINDAPVALNDTAVVDEDNTVIVNVLVNDSDVDGDSLTVTSANSAQGVVSVNPDSSLSFNPSANFNGAATINYSITDGVGGVANAVVNVTVSPVNDTPVAANDTAVVNEDGSVIVNVLANDSDIDGDSLTVTLVSSIQGAVIVNPDNSLSFNPSVDFNGAATIDYTISDGNGGAASAVVNVTVNAVNDIPVALNDTAVVDEDNTVVINVLANDSDVDGDSLTVTAASSVQGVVIVNPDNSLKFNPSADLNGLATIDYSISDGNGGTANALVNVTVNSINDAPVITSSHGDGSISSGATFSYQLVASDSDGDNLTYQLTEAPTGMTISTNGLLNWMPLASQEGLHSIAIAVSDGTLTATESFTLTVIDANPDWIATGGTITSSTLTDVVPSDSDFNGAMNGEASVSGGAANYSIPILVVPGRNGVQPSVALSYSSSGGNGIAGMGWNLSAGSGISRCGATIAQDGFSSNVQYSETDDRLCIDGQRLMVVSGTYGADGAVYRTEIDNLVNVTQSGNLNGTSTYFTATTPAGASMSFGQNQDAKVIAGGKTETLTWSIDKKTDSAGNTITYSYNSHGNGEYTLAAINYTGYGDTVGDRKVAFGYELRQGSNDATDFSTSYLAGGKTRKTQRLANIQTYYKTTLVNQYSLTYGAMSLSSGRTLLRSVQQCGYKGGVAQCFEPTTFDWQEAAPNYVMEPLEFIQADGSILAANNNFEVTNVVPRGDFDGNGSVDWPTLNNNGTAAGTGFSANAEGEIVSTHDEVLGICNRPYLTVQQRCFSPDFNQDGLTDAVDYPDWFMNGDPAEPIRIKYSGTNNWITTPIIIKKNDEDILAISDYNADGWPDISMVMRDNSDSQLGSLWIYLHTQDVTAPYSDSNRLKIMDYYYVTHNSIKTYFEAQTIGDMDGNGIGDFVVSRKPTNIPGMPVPEKILFGQVTTDGTSTLSFTEQAMTGHYEVDSLSNVADANFFHDVNADGLPDWLVVNDNKHLSFKLNMGGTFSSEWVDLGVGLPMREMAYSLNAMEADFIYMPIMSKTMVMDYNGDGRTELMIADDIVALACADISRWEGYGTQAAWVTGPYCGDQLWSLIRGLRDYDYLTAVDGDLYDISARTYNAVYFNEDASGNITASVEATDITAATTQRSVVDANGDGLADVITTFVCRSFDNCSWDNDGSSGLDQSKVYINRNMGAWTGPTKDADGRYNYAAIDLVKKVTSGIGVESQWQYRPLSSDAYDGINTANAEFYTPDHDYVNGGDIASSDTTHYHFGSSMMVVAEFQNTNGVGGNNQTLYQYSGATYNNEGRGFRGFRRITEVNVANDNLVTDTEFLQKFPFSSQVERQVVYQHNETVPMSIISNDWQLNTAHQTSFGAEGLYSLYNQKIRNITCDLEATSCDWNNNISKVETQINSVDIDQYGNVSQQTVTTSDVYGIATTITSTEYSSTAAWPNKVTSSTVSKSVVAAAGRPTTSINVDGTNVDTNTTQVVTTHYQAYDEVLRKPTTVLISPGTVTLTVDQCNSLIDCKEVTKQYNDYGLPSSLTQTGLINIGLTDNEVLQSRTTTFTYSSDGKTLAADGYFGLNKTQLVGTYAHQTTTHVDSATGQPIQVTDTLGVVTSTEYDALGRVLQINVAGSPTQYMRYRTLDSHAPTHAAMMLEITQIGSPTSASYADKLGRTLRTRTQGFDGSHIFTDVSYDARGNKVSESRPYQNTAINIVYSDFDVLGRAGTKVTPTVAGDMTTTYTYNGLTTDISVVPDVGETLTMSRSYNSLKQLMETTDAESGVTKYAYNGAGLPIVIRDAAANSIMAYYDDLGRKLWVDDPNQGKTDFVYNSFGELEKQIDANGETIRYDMDSAGRVVDRYTPDGNAHFIWDTVKVGLLSSQQQNAHSKSFVYDDYGRVTDTTTTIDGTTYIVSTQYDANYGRPIKLTYPNDLSIAYEYNNLGYLTVEKNAATGYIYRQITAQDALGNITNATMGNNVLTLVNEYNQAHNLMVSSQVAGMVLGSSGLIHSLAYSEHDSYGNIVTQSRTDEGISATESFIYDKLHRMTSSTRTISGTVSTINYGYDAVGNFKYKSDYSATNDDAYQYVAGTNQLDTITLSNGSSESYLYDANGNLTHRNGMLETSYDVFNKPLSINRKGASFSFEYGADLMRYKQVRNEDGKQITTHYIDKLYEVELEGQTRRWKAYISDVAIVSDTDNVGGHKKIRFTLRDRLGSAATFADHLGNSVSKRHFDPFGKPLGGDWSALDILFGLSTLKVNPQDAEIPTRRGFTDHEHLDQAELIHMNGRVYDYNVGRFMSVDPVIQSPNNSQSMNPYSYLMNNPLSGTDPTGYRKESETGFSVTTNQTQEGEVIKNIYEHRSSSSGKTTLVKVATITQKKGGDGKVVTTVQGHNGVSSKAVAKAVTGAVNETKLEANNIGSSVSTNEANSSSGENFKIGKNKLNRQEKELKVDRIAKKAHKKAKETIRKYAKHLADEYPNSDQEWEVDDFDSVPFELKSGFFSSENENSGEFTIASVKRNSETYEVEAVYIYASAIARVTRTQAIETFIHEFFHTTKPGSVLYKGYQEEVTPKLKEMKDQGVTLPSYRNRPHEHWAYAITAEAMKHK